jgi:hypothetical protein
MINKAIVVGLLAREFEVGSCEVANQDEKKLAAALKAMLNQCAAWDDFEVDDEEVLEAEERDEEEADVKGASGQLFVVKISFFFIPLFRF